jgi:hypothetical protein
MSNFEPPTRQERQDKLNGKECDMRTGALNIV